MTRTSTCILLFASLGLACSDDQTTTSEGGSSSSASTSSTSVSTTAPTTSATSTTGTPTTSATGGQTGTASMGTSEGTTEVSGTTALTATTTTAGSTTENMSTSSSSSTSGSSGGSSSTGPMPICNPGVKQCVDGQSFETCSGDGLMWEGPTACGAKEVCEFGACIGLCAQAEANASSIGCLYYAIDANNDPPENYDVQPYAVTVSNVNATFPADVKVQTYTNGMWTTIQQATVMPKTLKQFDLPDRHVNYTALNPRGAYKIVSDVPIIAYQFQPINGQTSYTSDASLLLPKTVYDKFYYVLGWGEPSFGNAQINIVAAEDGTNVTVTSKVATVAGGGIPALQANAPTALPVMNEADVVQIEANNMFSGTYITSDKPIAVFSTHWCGNIPIQTCCCDHLEEQVYGLQKWGTTYVASRWPPRNAAQPENSYWHLFASEDNTKVHIDAHAEVIGIGMTDFTMAKGQLNLLSVKGSVANPGDFMITADKPIYLMQYLSSSGDTGVGQVDKAGDPAMAQAVPVEQFRSDYIILTPSNWLYDYLVITRKAGTTVNLDGQALPQNLFTKVGPANKPTEWEVGRVPNLADGVHSLDGDQPFGVLILGYDAYDSYAYPGGLDQKVINPQ
jgi:hypothetical protein